MTTTPPPADEAIDRVLAIAAAARADERRRIRRLAIDKGAVYRTGLKGSRHFAPFADLLDETPEPAGRGAADTAQ